EVNEDYPVTSSLFSLLSSVRIPKKIRHHENHQKHRHASACGLLDHRWTFRVRLKCGASHLPALHCGAGRRPLYSHRQIMPRDGSRRNENLREGFCDALTFRRVLVDQSLIARIFAERIPGWIKLEQRDGEIGRDCEQMIEQTKCFIGFSGPSINLGERSGSLRPIKGVLGFRPQLNCAFPFGDGFLALTQRRKNEAVLRVPGSISGSFEEQFSRDLARALELCPRFGLIALEQVNHAFRESLWCRGRSGSKHRFTAKSFKDLKSIRKLPLQR